jgi:pimeloyl-ACP methyl ester carboxylesterase
MKSRSFISRILAIGIILSMSFSSCRKDNENGNSYFESKELIYSLDKTYILNLINVVGVSVPDAANLSGLVKNDIDIYRVVYKTYVKGEYIDASGLVCVPTETGDYPVISFQNGTNTLNSRAPSVDATDFGYQLIEVIASMGYVVVMADYPGFGSSAGIPHPYLIAEPTVRSLVDMLYAVQEMDKELAQISVKNEFFLMGYSQGGWATLELHRALELDYNSDINLKGSVCGAGPYNIYKLLQGMVNRQTYNFPIYIGYILNAYKAYNQFDNPVSDILNEPYASRLPGLYTGQLTSGQINDQLTTSISSLLNPAFLSGFSSSPNYAHVREALENNSVTPWHTKIPLMLIHGSADTQVDPSATENMYSAMIAAGTPESNLKKVILPGLDHGDGVAPSMIIGFLFLHDLLK